MGNSLLDKALLKYLLLFYGVAFLLSSVTGLVAKWEGFAYTSFGWDDLMGNMVIRYVAKFLFVFLGILLVQYLLVKKKMSRWIGLLLHGFFAICLTFYSVISQVIINNWVYGLKDPLTWEYIYGRAILGTDYNFFLYFCSAAIVYVYTYFKKQKEYEVKESLLKTQLLDSKINSLHTQLQPHFLFNTLNDISSLVDHSPKKAQDSIADLSDMLRQTLQLSETKFISLNEEVSLLKKYVQIEKIRYDDKLNISWDLALDTLEKEVPPLLFQPIVENTLKYGFSYDHDTLDLQITSQIEGDSLLCVIMNNGQPLPTSEVVYGVGLSNIISRLETLYEGNFEFEMKNRDVAQGVVTKIRIPV